MLVTRVSQLSGKESSMEIDITDQQIDAWHKGALIQNVMPHLNADEREFVMTGITKEEWDAAFKE